MTLEERLENWGRVVRSPRFQRGVCASWAQWFVSLRGFVSDEEDLRGTPSATISKEELDGWMIERCWRQLLSVEAKWVLKYVYVWRLSNKEVAIKLRESHGIVIRERRVQLALIDARQSLSRELVRIEPRHYLAHVKKSAAIEETCL